MFNLSNRGTLKILLNYLMGAGPVSAVGSASSLAFGSLQAHSRVRLIHLPVVSY